MLTDKIVKGYEQLVEQGEVEKRITSKLDAIVQSKQAELRIDREQQATEIDDESDDLPR